MTTDKDKQAIEKSKKLIEQQIEETKKLDLGLDADGSSKPNRKSKSTFDGFLNRENLSSLDGK